MKIKLEIELDMERDAAEIESLIEIVNRIKVKIDEDDEYDE